MGIRANVKAFFQTFRGPAPPPIRPLSETGHHWPERDDDKDPVQLPESWFSAAPCKDGDNIRGDAGR